MDPPVQPLTLYGFWCDAPLQLPAPIATPNGDPTDIVDLCMDVRFHIDDEFIVLQSVELSQAGTRIAGSATPVNIVSHSNGIAWLLTSIDPQLDLTMAVKDQIQRPESRLRSELIKIWTTSRGRAPAANLGVRVQAGKKVPWGGIVAACCVVSILVLASAYFALYGSDDPQPDIVNISDAVEDQQAETTTNSTIDESEESDDSTQPPEILKLMHYVETERVPGVLREVDVVWSTEPDEKQLREAARIIRDEAPDFERISISHFTPDHGIDLQDTPWATTNFDPEFSLRIIGILADELAQLRRMPPAEGSVENIGYWLDPTMKCRIAIDRHEDGSYFLTSRMVDDTQSTPKRIDRRGSKYYVPGSTTGEYYTTGFDGALLAYDYDGLNGTFKVFQLQAPDETSEPNAIADKTSAETDEPNATDNDSAIAENDPSDNPSNSPTAETAIEDDPGSTTESKIEPESEPDYEPVVTINPQDIKHKSPVRTWHYKDGGYVEASYVCRIGLDLSLRRADTGEMINIQTGQLTFDDVKWMRKWERRDKLHELDDPHAWGGQLKQ